MKILNLAFCAVAWSTSLSLMGSSSQSSLSSLDDSGSGSSVDTSGSIGQSFSMESCLSDRISVVERKLTRNDPVRDVLIQAADVHYYSAFIEDGDVDQARIDSMNVRVDDYLAKHCTSLEEYFFISIFQPNDYSLTNADFTTFFESDFYMKKINSAFLQGMSSKRCFPGNNNLSILISHYAQEAKRNSHYEACCKKALECYALTGNNVLFYAVIQDLKNNEIADSFFDKLYAMFLIHHPYVYLAFETVIKELEGNKTKQGLSRHELISVSLSDLNVRVKKRLGGYSSVVLPWVIKYACMKRFDLPFDQMLSLQDIQGSLDMKKKIISKIGTYLKTQEKNESSFIKRDSQAKYINLKSPFKSADIDAACKMKIDEFNQVAKYLESLIGNR